MGCAKNEVDSSKMARALSEQGFAVIDDVSFADMVVVNTCSFIQSATEESIAAILDAADLPNVRDGAKLVVAGCMPARYGSELASEFPEVSAFVPCSDEASIIDIAEELLGDADDVSSGLPASEESHNGAFRSFCLENAAAVADYAVGPEGGSGTSAYVKISDGCDRWCSYCTIPKIRGRYHSFSRQQICDDVKIHIDLGVKEIVLIAQDTGRWGCDFPESDSLAGLLRYLADDFPDIRFRAMYIQPEGVTDDLLDAIASRDNICDYLDIPIQHVSQHILHAMNRRGSVGEYAALFDRITDKVPGIALRTTLIAGFPGETEADFEELVDFVENSQLDYIGVFPYSREEGTRAYDMPDQLNEEEKSYRASRLRDLADTVCAANISRRIGSSARVLVEGRESDGQLFGRSEWQAPDVDGITFVSEGEPGEIVEVVIDDTLFYDMEGSSDNG